MSETNTYSHRTQQLTNENTKQNNMKRWERGRGKGKGKGEGKGSDV